MKKQFQSKSIPRGTRTIWRYLGALFLLFTFAIGQMWGDETAVAYSFENNKVDESGYTQSTGDGNRAISSTVNRTGSYSLEQDNNNTSAKNCKIIVPIPSNKTKYVHVIAYLKKSSTATGNISLKSYCLYQGGGLGTVSPNSNLGTGWTRIATKGNKNNSSTYTTLELRINTQTATKGDKFYVDDVVMYTTTGDAKTDLKKPGSATITAHSTDALTWTSGTDLADDDCDATGVQKTLIFKKTSGTVSELNLNDQGVYSLTAKDGPSTVGDWTLVAVVDPSTESYTTGLTAGHHYAIVHRDLAYNYSNPVYTTIIASCNEPTTAFANGSYTIDGTPLTLSSLISNSQGDGAISYEVKDANGTGASIAAGVFTATTAGSATVTATQAADATNGYCEKIMDATITVQPAGSVEYGISYLNTKGVTNTNPAKYTKGVGITSFAALEDTEDYHFMGWSPASIPTTATADPFEVTASWEAKKVVTFDAGLGSAVATQKVVSGATISAPSSTRLNWTLQGWTLDPTAEPVVLYDFTNAITDDLDFTAVWTRSAISGTTGDPIILVGSTVSATKTPLTNILYFNKEYTSGDFGASGGMGGDVSTKTDYRYVGFTIPEDYTGTVYVNGRGSSGRKIAVVTEADRATSTWTNNYLELTMTGTSNDINGTSTTMNPGVYCIGSEGSGLTIKDVQVTLTKAPLTATFKANGTTLYVIQATTGETLGNMFLNGELPTPSVDGFTFNGWKNGESAVLKTTAVGSTSLVLNADLTPIAYNVTLESNNSKADGAATVHVGDAVLTIATAPAAETGYGLLGYYTGATNDVLVADASGNLVASVTGYTDENAKWIKAADATLYAQWEDIASVAQIAEAKYTSLEAALEHAADGEIVLLQDIDVDAQVEIADGVSATIDLAGHKIEYTSATTLPSGVILVHNGASLTINDSGNPDAGSVVSGDKAYAAVALTKLGDDASNPATLVVNGGTLTGYYYGITGNGSRNNTVITINGGMITGTVGIAIYHPQVGTLTVNNGSLTGEDAAIEMRAGTLVINDGTFTATATEFSCDPNGSGSTTSGAAIAIAQHTTKKEISVTINGGTFNGVKALNESNPQVNDPAPQVAMAITNGTFNGAVSTVDVNNFVSGGSFSEPVAESQCATDYYPATKPNGKYGVTYAAESIDFEAFIDENGTDDAAKTLLASQLAAKHYELSEALNTDHLDAPAGKPQDKGFKVKKTGLEIYFSVEPEKVLEIKTGNISGASIAINGGAAEDLTSTSIATHTYYNDNAQAVVLTMTKAGDKYNIFQSINIRNPYKVTLDATTNGGEAVAPMYGKLSVTLPSATKGTDHFIGWYDAAENGTLVGLADAEYTPTANITLYAHFAPQSNDGRLSDLQVDGTTVDGFDMDVHIYNLTVPYGTAVSALPKITLATAYDSYAQGVSIYPTDGPEWRADVDGGCYVQQANVTAEDGFVVYNQVRTKILPKDMACLVWADVPSANTLTYNATKSLMAEDAVTLAINNVSGTDGPAGVKFQKKGYIKIEMNEGTFQAGDVVALDVTGAAGSTMHVFKVQTPSSEADVIGTGEGTTTPVGVNKVAITEDAAALYLARPNDGTYNGWNPHVDYVAVYRPVPNPLVETITFNGAAGVVDNTASPKTITVEVPATTDLATMPVLANFYSNDPSLTSGAVTGTWAEGDNEYIVTDKDNDQTVYTVTITKAVPSNDATLSALSYGGTAIALADGVYEYDVELPYGTSAVPALAATAHHAGASVTNITDATEFVNRHATSTVTVTAEDNTTTQLYTVNFTISAWKDVAIWDGSTMSAVATSPDATGLAWATTGFGSIANYNTTCGEKSYTKVLPSSGAATGRYMTITVPKDYVAKFYVVMASHSDGSERGMFIGSNLVKNPDATSILELSNNDRDVAVAGMSEIVGEGTYYINPNNSIDFQEIRAYLRPGYARTSMLGNGVYGTVCVPNNVAIEDIQGVTVYELMGREPQYGKLAFDEIISGELEAGAPYVFQAHGDKMIMFYGEDHEDAPVDKGNGMYGTFEQVVLTELDDVYYFAQKALWSCDGAVDLTVGANRAYVKLSEIDYLTDPNPAPGRRRVTMTVNGEKVTTDIENLNASEKPVKLLINGQIFILRGEKMYDATGKLVK